MGKRELLIIIVFVAIGTVAYQIAAPPATGDRGFSITKIFTEARKEMRGNPGSGKYVHKASVPIPADLREVRLIGVSEGVKILGDASGENVEYEFTVTSNGPDDAAALGYAKETALERDDLGDSMVFRAVYPKPASQRSTIVMHVPARLAVRIEGSLGADVKDVAAVHLEAMRSTVTLSNVAGSITGVQQDGDFIIAGAKSVKLRLIRSKSKISKVTGGLTLDLRDTDSEITESAGALEVDETRSDLSVSDHKGTIVVRGNDGSITIGRPTQETRVDVRRAEVEVLVERAVAMTIITSDEPLRLILAGLRRSSLMRRRLMRASRPRNSISSPKRQKRTRVCRTSSARRATSASRCATRAARSFSERTSKRSKQAFLSCAQKNIVARARSCSEMLDAPRWKLYASLSSRRRHDHTSHSRNAAPRFDARASRKGARRLRSGRHAADRRHRSHFRLRLRAGIRHP